MFVSPPLRYFNFFYTNTFFSLSFFGASSSIYTSSPSPDNGTNTHTNSRVTLSQLPKVAHRSHTHKALSPNLCRAEGASEGRRAVARSPHGPHGKRSRAHQVSSVAQATLSDALVSHPREGGGRDAALPPCPGSSPSRSSLLPLQALLAAPFPRCPLVFPGRPPVCVCRL